MASSHLDGGLTSNLKSGQVGPKCADGSNGMIDVLDDLVKGAVAEVFGTMLSIRTVADQNLKLVSTPEQHIASSVGFIGQVTGIVFIYSRDSFARQITSRMLGIREAEVKDDEMVNDSMGELGNMVVGHIKSRLCDKGMSCVLTIPSIVRGTHFSIEPTAGTTRRVIGFHCGDSEQVAIEILLKPTQGPLP
jgi:chemotaxis protein CheX